MHSSSWVSLWCSFCLTQKVSRCSKKKGEEGGGDTFKVKHLSLPAHNLTLAKVLFYVGNRFVVTIFGGLV
jgi:hypothetical protein